MNRAAALLLLSALLTSGCASIPRHVVQEPTRDGPMQVPAPVRLANNATACTRTFLAVFLEKGEAQGLLPAGFSAADAKDFFGLPGPAPTGKGLALLSIARCAASQAQPAGYDEAMAGIFVEAPRVNGTDPLQSNAYELGRATSAGPVHDALAAIGWNLTGDAVEVSYASTPVPSGSGRVSGATGELFGSSSRGSPASDSFSERIRWWRALPTGLAFFEYAFTVDGHLGPGSCTAAAGSPFARAMRATACPPGSLFMVGPPFDIEGRLEFHPGLQAAV